MIKFRENNPNVKDVKGISVTNEDWSLFLFKDKENKEPILKSENDIYYLDDNKEIRIKNQEESIKEEDWTRAIKALEISKICFKESNYIEEIPIKEGIESLKKREYLEKHWKKDPIRMLFTLSVWEEDIKVSHWLSKIDNISLSLILLSKRNRLFFEVDVGFSNNKANKNASHKFGDNISDLLKILNIEI